MKQVNYENKENRATMVCTAEELAMLEAIKNDMLRGSYSDTLRVLVHEEFKRRNLKPATS